MGIWAYWHQTVTGVTVVTGPKRNPKGDREKPQSSTRGAQEVVPEGAQEGRGCCVWCFRRKKKIKKKKRKEDIEGGLWGWEEC
jgi:hypothetical protein